MTFVLIVLLAGIGLVFLVKSYERNEVINKIDEIIANSPGLWVDNVEYARNFIGNILIPIRNALYCEAAIAVYLNETDRIVSTDIRLGNSASVFYSSDEILQNTVKKEAIKVILGHHYPGNFSAPRYKDISNCASIYRLLSERQKHLIGSFMVCRSEIKSIMDTEQFKQMIQPK